MKSAVLIGLIILMATGCSVPMVASLEKKPAYVPKADSTKGAIYFYRESEYMGSLRGIYILVNGKRVGALNNGTYFVHEAEPGDAVVALEDKLTKDPTRVLKIEAGKAYYIKGALKMGMWEPVPAISIVAPEEGEGAIKQLTYATMKEKDLKK